MIDHDGAREIRRATQPFQTPLLGKSIQQLATSFGGFAVTCAAMYAALEVSIWVTLALSPLAAGFLVRIFILQHDCGHAALFRSRWLNDLIGHASSVLTLTPYLAWRRQHAGHHGIWNDLDRRQSGVDIYSHCLTVEEYRGLTPRQRWIYRVTRHPIIANLLLPPLVFLLLYRVPFDMPKSWRHERRGVYLTSIALVLVYGGLGLALGFGSVALAHLPIVVLGSIAGVWLFSVQHRGENVQWSRHDAWDAVTAALRSSTYLELPRILQWFTGNIGFHHVHHLNPRIPNYRLQECHEQVLSAHEVPRITLWDGLGAMTFSLWDEAAQRMVSVRDASSPGSVGTPT